MNELYLTITIGWQIDWQKSDRLKLHQNNGEEQTVCPVEGRPFKGVFYPSPERAVKVFAKMYEYHRFLVR